MSCIQTEFLFYPGEDTFIELQLKLKDQNGCKQIYPLELTDEITVTLPAKTVDLVLVSTGASPKVTIPTGRQYYGEIKVELDSVATADLLNGTIIIKVVRAGKSKFFLASGALKKVATGNC